MICAKHVYLFVFRWQPSVPALPGLASLPVPGRNGNESSGGNCYSLNRDQGQHKATGCVVWSLHMERLRLTEGAGVTENHVHSQPDCWRRILNILLSQAGLRTPAPVAPRPGVEVKVGWQSGGGWDSNKCGRTAAGQWCLCAALVGQVGLVG